MAFLGNLDKDKRNLLYVLIGLLGLAVLIRVFAQKPGAPAVAQPLAGTVDNSGAVDPSIAGATSVQPTSWGNYLSSLFTGAPQAADNSSNAINQAGAVIAGTNNPAGQYLYNSANQPIPAVAGAASAPTSTPIAPPALTNQYLYQATGWLQAPAGGSPLPNVTLGGSTAGGAVQTGTSAGAAAVVAGTAQGVASAANNLVRLVTAPFRSLSIPLGVQRYQTANVIANSAPAPAVGYIPPGFARSYGRGQGDYGEGQGDDYGAGQGEYAGYPAVGRGLGDYGVGGDDYGVGAIDGFGGAIDVAQYQSYSGYGRYAGYQS